MDNKIILEINTKLIFNNEQEFIQYISQTELTSPDLYAQFLNAQAKKMPSINVLDGELGKRTRTVRVYEMGLAVNDA